MTKKQKQLAALFYAIGMFLFVYGFYSTPIYMALTFAGGINLVVAWVMCLKAAYRQGDYGLWFYFILIMGALAMPIYLINGAKNNPTA